MVLLETKGLTKEFGGLRAVAELDLQLHEGEILGLIGPNGAGKTTVFNLISGVFRPSRGQVIFKGEDVTGHRPDVIASKGLVRTFQSNTLFHNNTVLDNVLVAFHLRAKMGWRTLFNTRGARDREKDIYQKATEILEFLGLAPLKSALAKSLPHGHQRALGVAIAMAAGPKLLMLDEPVTGMNPEETIYMMKLMQAIRAKGVSILLVEHNMRAIMGVCDRIVAMSYGKKIADGTPEEIRQNTEVIKAYLGTTQNVA